MTGDPTDAARPTAEYTTTCPRCGKVASIVSNYCPRCGRRLREDAL